MEDAIEGSRGRLSRDYRIFPYANRPSNLYDCRLGDVFVKGSRAGEIRFVLSVVGILLLGNMQILWMQVEGKSIEAQLSSSR